MEEKAIPSPPSLDRRRKCNVRRHDPSAVANSFSTPDVSLYTLLNKDKGRSLFTFSLQRPRIDEGAHREPQRRRQRALPVAHREPAPVLAFRRALRGADGDRQRP